MSLEHSWRNMAYGERWSALHLLAPLLWPLSFAYGAMARMRRWAYRNGLIKPYIADVPVLSVGNLTVGGSGKTPFTIYLAQRLKEWGYEPAILMRGYRRKGKNENVVTPNNFDSNRIEEYGDEASLIVHTSNIPVGIGCKRSSVAMKILQETKCNILLLDDGFQHLPLHRDMDIVMLDAQNPLGNKNTLPYGPLREPIATLRWASAIVWNGAPPDDPPKGHLADIQQFHGELQWRSIIPLAAWMQGGHSQGIALGDFPYSEIQLLSGIGNPARLQHQAEANGFHILKHQVYEDHHWFRPDEVHYAQLTYPETPLLCTEKDAIRLTPILDQLGDGLSSIYVVQAGWLMHKEHVFFEWLRSMLQKIIESKEETM